MITRICILLAPLVLATCVAEPETSHDYAETIRGTTVDFDMVWIPEGEFWIGRTEVTWDEFLPYCDFAETGNVPPDADAVTKPSKPLDVSPYDRDWGVGRRPAVGVSLNAAERYCEWLSLNTGHTYRLPNGWEWALACGDAADEPVTEQAWCAENSDGMTEEVAQKAPNEHGLYDMLGNLWEYCANPWSDDEPDRAVLRGGSWMDPASEITPAGRLRFDDDWVLKDPNVPPGVWWVPDGGHLGFRVLREGKEAR